MPATIRYFAARLSEEWQTELCLVHEGKASSSLSPKINGIGIVSPWMRLSDDILYIDLGKGEVFDGLAGKSVVATRARARHFPRSDLIVVPDDSDAQAVFWELSNILSELLEWRTESLNVINRSDSLQELTELFAHFLGNPGYLSNAGMKVLASASLDLDYISPAWRYQHHYGYLSYDVMQTLIDNGELAHMGSASQPYIVRDTSIYSLPYLCCPIRKDGKIHGYVFVIGLYRDLDDSDIEVADEFASLLATSSRTSLDAQTFEGMSAAYFVESVLDGSLTDCSLIDRQIRAMPKPLPGDYAVFVFDAHKDNDAVRHHVMALLNTEFSAMCLAYAENVVAIFSTFSGQSSKIKERLRSILQDYNRYGAISEPFLRFEDLPRYYRQALFALHESEGRRVPEKEFRLAEYEKMFFAHVAKLAGKEVTEYAPAVRLLQYDEKHGSELSRSLLVWLRCERNTVQASSELFIHRNTLSYRLEKASKILKADLDDWSVQTRLLYTLRDVDLRPQAIPKSSAP